MLIPTMMHLGRPRYINVMQSEYTNEYVRLSQLDLAIHEIKQHGIAGDVAEVGVYKGDFAAVLNQAIPERKLYLFDTFERFPSDQEFADTQQRGLNHKRDFTDTNVNIVLNRMTHPDMCIIRKGVFPETATGLEDCRFCFVSLDGTSTSRSEKGLTSFMIACLREVLSLSMTTTMICTQVRSKRFLILQRQETLHSFQ